MRSAFYTAAVMVAVGIWSICPASANTCGGSSTCSPTGLQVFSGTGSFAYSDGTTAQPVKTTGFVDTFEFELIPPPAKYDTATVQTTSSGGTLSGLSVSIWECPTLAACDTGGTNVGGTFTTGTLFGVQVADLVVNGLTDAFYYLKILTTGATQHTSYGGELSATAVPVGSPTPLPATAALFAGGLGLLGFAGMRKRRKADRSLHLAA